MAICVTGDMKELDSSSFSRGSFLGELSLSRMTNTATLLLLTAACLSLAVAGPAAGKAACGRQQFTCQLQDLIVINCSSSEAVVPAAAGADAYPRFVQNYPNFEPSRLSLILPARGGASSNFTVADLGGLVTCFQLTDAVTLRLVAGTAEFQLTPRSLAAFRGMRRITLWLRFLHGRIPPGLFSAELAANLENLQLETPGVSEVAPGAFQQLRRLTRLSISNLKIHSLTGDTLRGLEQLRVLELWDNGLLRLDAASFSASPSLQSVDLRTRSAGGVRLAPDTFCGLADLRQLQAPVSWGLDCSHFASAKIHLMLSRGTKVDILNCVRLLGQKKCGTTTVRELTLTPTVASKATTKTTATTVTTTAKTTTLPKPTSTSTTATSTTKTSTTLSRSTTTSASVASSSSSSSSSSRPGRRSPDRQASSSSAGPAVAVVLVAVALILAGAAIAAFMAARGRRFGGLRRAASRQPIFSAAAGGSMIDMRSIDGQDMQQWNPAYQQMSSPAADEAAVARADRVENR